MASGSTIVNATYNSSGARVCDVLKFSWQENSQSVANNTTTVGWKMELISYEYGYINSSAKKNWSVTVNGQKYSGTNTIGIAKNSTKTLASGTTTIAHNSDGTKSFSYSFSQDFKIDFNTYVGTISGSGSGTLTTIARASQPSLITYPENTQDVGYFGDTISVHMNRASSSFTHKVRYEFGSMSGTCIDADTGKAATAVETGFRWTIPKSLVNEIPFDDEGTGRIFVETYNGSTLIGEEKYSGFTAKVPDTAEFSPKCSLSLSDPTGIHSTYGYYVQGLSKIQATISETLAYGSVITSWSIEVDGKTYNSRSATTGFLTKTGTYNAKCTVKDGRGRTASKPVSITVKEYKKPIIEKLSAIRCNIDGKPNKRGGYVKVTFSASVTSLDGKNNATYRIQFKKTSDTGWTTLNANNEVNKYSPDNLVNNFAPENETFIFEANTSNSYDIIAYATDRHNANDPTTRSTKAPTGSAIFSWRGFKNSSGIVEDGAGIGRVPEKPNTLQVGWDAEFDSSVRGKVFGLGTLTLIPNGSDLNDYVVPGVYSVATDASAGTITNMPKETAGRLIISDSTGTEPSEDFVWEYKEQMFLPHDIGRGGVPWVRQIRRQKSSQWTYYPWHTYGLFAYPVGAIYIAYNHDDPATLFGGTWVRIVNRFLWAADEEGGMGVVGGEKTVTLTVDQIPSHNHGGTYTNAGTSTKTHAWLASGGSAMTYESVNAGGGEAHNNMPPYIQVSIWRRTA
jgi:hypothetical protein